MAYSLQFIIYILNTSWKREKNQTAKIKYNLNMDVQVKLT